MSEPNPTTCPRCGSPLDPERAGGLCPQCLLAAGFESDAALDPGTEPGPEATPEIDHETPTVVTSGFVPPRPEELDPLFPQLDVLELLGKGGMGAVYKARQPSLDRVVALKILPPEVATDPSFAERFTREARALAKLNHPNIVTVHDVGRAGDLYYFVMEYVDGANLREVIRRGDLEPSQALAIVPQICDALQYAHDEGVVHRDIKPENVLLDKKGRVKIADFGLAKLLGVDVGDISLTGTAQVMGTLRYMAPEQMQGTKSVDHRADIYALGVVFYELLTGEVPMGRFPPPSQRVQVDVRLDEVVLRALESEPDKRYQRAGDLKHDTELASSAEVVRSSPTIPPETAPDAIVYRRLTGFIAVVWLFWAGVWIIDLVGYLRGVDWYFEMSFQRGLITWGMTVTSIPLVILLVQWWYLLAKDPGTRRSLDDFFLVSQSPDRRTLRYFAPAGIFAGVYIAVMAVAMAQASDALQATTMYVFLVAAPPLFMRTSVRVYGTPDAPRARDESPTAGSSATGAGSASPKPVGVSWKSILGAVFAVPFLVLFLGYSVLFYPLHEHLWIGLLPLLITLVPGTPTFVLGALAVRDVRSGRRWGMPLAMFDLLVMPLGFLNATVFLLAPMLAETAADQLVAPPRSIDGARFATVEEAISAHNAHEAAKRVHEQRVERTTRNLTWLIAVPVCLLGNWLIVRHVWRANVPPQEEIGAGDDPNVTAVPRDFVGEFAETGRPIPVRGVGRLYLGSFVAMAGLVLPLAGMQLLEGSGGRLVVLGLGLVVTGTTIVVVTWRAARRRLGTDPLFVPRPTTWDRAFSGLLWTGLGSLAAAGIGVAVCIDTALESRAQAWGIVIAVAGLILTAEALVLLAIRSTVDVVGPDGAPLLSKKAVFGGLLTPLFLFATGTFAVEELSMNSFGGVLPSVFITLPLAIVACLLGGVAIRDVRTGRRWGLPLAVYDLLVLPLAVLNAAVVFVALSIGGSVADATMVDPTLALDERPDAPVASSRARAEIENRRLRLRHEFRERYERRQKNVAAMIAVPACLLVDVLVVLAAWRGLGPQREERRAALALDVEDEIIAAWPDRVAAIRVHRRATGSSLAEAKRAVERLAAEHGLPGARVTPRNIALLVALIGLGTVLAVGVIVALPMHGSGKTILLVAAGVVAICMFADVWRHARGIEVDEGTADGTPRRPWAQRWLSLPLGKRRLARGLLLVVYLGCLIAFYTVHVEGRMVFAPGHEEDSTYRGTIGTPTPWFVAERRPNGFRTTMQLLSPTLLLAAVAGGVYGLHWTLRTIETVGPPSALERPTVQVALWVVLGVVGSLVLQVPLFWPG